MLLLGACSSSSGGTSAPSQSDVASAVAGVVEVTHEVTDSAVAVLQKKIIVRGNKKGLGDPLITCSSGGTADVTVSAGTGGADETSVSIVFSACKQDGISLDGSITASVQATISGGTTTITTSLNGTLAVIEPGFQGDFTFNDVKVTVSYTATEATVTATGSISVGGVTYSFAEITVSYTYGSGATSSEGDAGDGGSASLAEYDSLKGTFVAPGLNLTLSGAFVGTYENTTTQWNAEGTFDLAASGGSPTPLVLSGTLPSGDTAGLIINLSQIPTTPAGGTFSCDGSGDYQLQALFQLTPKGSATASKEYSTTTCTLKLDTPKSVSEPSDEGAFTVYFAHGSFTAKMSEYMVGGTTDGTTAVLTATW